MTKLLSIISLVISVTANAQSFKTITIEEQLEDIEFIKAELQNLHPGVYTHQSEQEFEDGFQSLKESLQEDETVFNFYNVLVPVINQIGCGHTTSKIPTKALKRIQKIRKYLPLEIKIIDGKIYVTKVLVEHTNLAPGLEILSIDNVSASDYIKSNLDRYPSDGRIQSRKYQNLEKNFSIDYSTYHYTNGNFKIEVGQKGSPTVINVAGISYDELTAKTRQPIKKAMEFTIIDSISTAIITVRNSESKRVFDGFLENSFYQIDVQNIAHLIIDIRYDSFNRDSDGAELFSYLTSEPFRYYDQLEVTENYDVPKAIRWFTHYPIEQDNNGKYYWTIHPQLEIQPPKPKAFLGKVYVLTDGFTFSATAEFSSIVKSTRRGQIIGRETGGSYYGNNSGGMLRKVLPNSRMILYVPPIHYRMAVNDLGNYSRGVIPDVLANEKIDDLYSNQDLIKEAALQLILAE